MNEKNWEGWETKEKLRITIKFESRNLCALNRTIAHILRKANEPDVELIEFTIWKE